MPTKRRDPELDRLLAEYHKEQEKQGERNAARDLRMKRKGYTHKVLACIHPSAGGDDFFTQTYFKGEPTKVDIAALLRKSAVKDDYRVEVL